MERKVDKYMDLQWDGETINRTDRCATDERTNKKTDKEMRTTCGINNEDHKR